MKARSGLACSETGQFRWLAMAVTVSLLAISAAGQDGPDGATVEKMGPEARTAYLLWQKARSEADRAYVRALQAALEKATKAGRLEEAVLIKKELERLAGGGVLTANEAKAKEALGEWLVGTSWHSEFNGVIVKLEKDGKGTRHAGARQTPITWELISGNSFRIRWPSAPASTAALAADRKSFVSGDVKWSLRP